MKFKAVRIHFLSEVFGLLSYKFMPPWQPDVMTSPLYCHTLLELSNHLNEHQYVIVMYYGIFSIIREFEIKDFSKIQLVVYYHCCILIGWATTRLYVMAPSSEKHGLFGGKKGFNKV